MKVSYFGLPVINDWFVRKNDIKNLPFYEFWEESSIGSTVLKNGGTDDDLVPLVDWERFSRLFIKTGKHRWSASDD